VRIFFCLILSLIFSQKVLAFESANPYWLNLKPKVESFLAKNINTNSYKYELIGPVTEMTTFLGNRPDAKIKFEKFYLGGSSSRKTFLASAYDDSGKKIDSLSIAIDVLAYRKVYMLKTRVARGAEISSGSVYQSGIPIRQMDSGLYYDGNLSQKVATVDIPAGVPIRVNMVRHEKLVHAGDIIKVTSGSKTIELKFMCKALGSGDVGEVINLICTDMERKNTRATITGKGEATLI
jgi:flagella basal body P-ring formation protein FlgA